MWKNKSKEILTLSFDDSYQKTVKNTLPLLNQYQMVASFNVIVNLIGKEFEGLKLASYADLKKAASQEIEIASHSLTHTDLVKRGRIRKFLKSFPQQHHRIKLIKENLKSAFKQKKKKRCQINQSLLEEEIIKSKTILTKKGFDIASFVYPSGAYNKKIKDFVGNYYSSARSLDTGLNDYQIKDFYALKAFTWYKWTTPSVANRWVDKAIKKKAWLIEVFHFVADKNKTDYKHFTSVADFEEHLKYIKSRNIWVATQKEVVKYIQGKK